MLLASDTDLTASRTNLITAIICFLTAILMIVPIIAGILKDPGSRKTATSILVITVSIGFPVVGVLLLLFLPTDNPYTLGCLLISTVIISINYVRKQEPVQRIENVSLVVAWASAVFLLTFHQMMKMSALLEHVLNQIDKLMKFIH